MPEHNIMVLLSDFEEEHERIISMAKELANLFPKMKILITIVVN